MVNSCDIVSLALERYWAARTAEDERRAYAEMLSLGLPPAYGESEDCVDRLLARYGLRRDPDMLAITRNVAREGSCG